MQQVAKRVAGILRPPRQEGCTQETARCDFWNWGPDALRPQCCTDHLIELTVFVHELLDRHGITHWLEYGTLLGAVREGAFIPWDEDVDFGVLEADVRRILALEPEIVARGYAIDTSSGPGSIRIRYSRANELHVDLFWWRDQDGHLVSDFSADYEWPGLHNRTSFPAGYLDQLQPVYLYGRQYPAPSPVHDFLVEHRFGSDYMVPARPIMAVWLRPEIGPDELTPAVRRLLASLAEKEGRLAELKYRSRLSRARAWQAWRNAGLPLAPPPSYVDRAIADTPPPERTETVERLAYSVAAFDHAIDELSDPPRFASLRRAYRRGIRAKDMVVAKLRGASRKGFGQR
jgi:hypothetical protein